jgi:lipid-A-disaccharide synthase
VTRESASSDVMIVAGEASGDLHGATLARHLRRLAPATSLVGMGGPRMAEAGVHLLVDASRLAVVGVAEALGRLPGLYGAYRRLVGRLVERPPRAVVLIDFPEFNLRLARAAGRRGVPIVYFIPPQVWAWRPGRTRLLARLVTRVLAVFPFEVSLYESAGAPVVFVGHPLLDALASAPGREDARAAVGAGAGTPLVGLLPGSRREEVERLLPEMARAAALVRGRHPAAEFLLGLAPTVDREAVDRILGVAPVKVTVLEGGAHQVMAAADLLLVASGTATLEGALLGTPMVVCYRVGRTAEWMGRLLIRIPWISLVNILSGRPVVPELLQSEATGARIAEEALRLLGSAEAREAQRRAFAEIRGRLGSPGVGERAAREVLAVAGLAS